MGHERHRPHTRLPPPGAARNTVRTKIATAAVETLGGTASAGILLNRLLPTHPSTKPTNAPTTAKAAS